ncbi:MAG: hypothetical protein LBC61_03630 [Candidatus Peribacteria bacterium]|nr:hypothetical protein [Candidatus Peribacteria bacterium]
MLSTIVFKFCLYSHISQLEKTSSLGFVKNSSELLEFKVYLISVPPELNKTK